MDFRFLNPGVLWALAAAAIPFLIYWRQKRPRAQVVFSDLWLVQKILKKIAPKNRRQDWLRILLRTLMILSLILFFAKPFSRGMLSSAQNSHSTVVLLVDRSYSMQTAENGKSRFQSALDLAQQSLKALSSKDAAGLVIFSDSIDFASGWTTHDFSTLALKLKETSVSNRPTRIFPALEKAAELLKTSEPARKIILVFSDMAQHAFEGKPTENLLQSLAEQKIEIFYVDFPATAANRYWSQLRLEPDFYSEELRLKAVVKTFNDAAAPWEIYGFPAQRPLTQAQLTPQGKNEFWGTAQLSLYDSPLAGQARLTADALAVDNSFYWTRAQAQKIRVAIVEENLGLGSSLSASHFLREALVAAPSRFEVEALSKADFSRRTLNSTQVVIWVDPAAIDLGTQAKLTQFLRSDGALLVSAGPRAALERTESWNNLLPCKVGEIKKTPQQKMQPNLQLDGELDFFTRDYDLNSVNIAQTRAVQLDAAAEVPWILSDGSPLLVTDENAKTALWLSGWDLGSGNFVSKPLFVPWIRWTVENLARRHKAEETAALRVGESLRRKISASEKNSDWELLNPQGQKLSLQRSAEELRSAPLETPGVYTLKSANSEKREFWAVNLDFARNEGNLKKVSAAELQNLFANTPWKAVAAQEPFAQNLRSVLEGQDFSRMFLLLAVLFLIADLWL